MYVPWVIVCAATFLVVGCAGQPVQTQITEKDRQYLEKESSPLSKQPVQTQITEKDHQYLEKESSPLKKQGFVNTPSPVEQYKAEEKAKEATIIGKTYTYMFGRQSCDIRSPIRSSPSLSSSTEKYRALGPQEFTVLQTVSDRSLRYFEVQMQDGTTGYIIITPALFRTAAEYAPDKTSNYELFRSNYELFQLREGCLFEATVDEITKKIAEQDAVEATRKKKQEQNAEKQKREDERRAKLPGARIGMTAKEVIEKTSWGHPVTINRTIVESGRHEQWVYSDNQYLYFRNGRLTAIQNSQ